MAGGSFASDPSFDAYNQQVSPAMASYFQTMGQLERSRSRLMEVSQGVVGAVPGAFNMAQAGLARISSGMSYMGAGASAFHGQFLGAYNRYQGPMTGKHDFMGPGTAIAGLMGAQPFIQGRFQYEGSLIARDVAMQNFNMAVQDSARTALTQFAPQAAMMAGFAMGGIPGTLIAGAGVAASLTAPMILRGTGLDAQLHSERFRRQVQLTVGERLGDMGGANRFRLSRDAAAGASAAVTDYVSDVQRQYGWFAPEAREFEPLVQAAIATTSDKDLPKILESGAKGLKDRISALRDAAAVLNTNFEEIAQLATKFGEDSELGVGGRFDRFVRDVNNAATRGRGLNRQALMQAGIQARDQAIAQGFQGEATQRGLVSLAADIQERANLGLISRDYLFAFGGRTQSEAAINTALATQQMERNMAMGPFGMMALGRMRGGGGMGGGLLGGAGQLGRAFTQDPFGFMLAPYDPQTRTRMAQDAPYELFTRMEQTFGGGQFGQLAFLKTLQSQTGMDDAQAMSQYRRIRGERATLAKSFGGRTGLSEDRLMNAYLNARGMTPGLTIGEFSGGGFTDAQIKALAAGSDIAALTMGATNVGPTILAGNLTDAEIAKYSLAKAEAAMERTAVNYANDVPGGVKFSETDTFWDRAGMGVASLPFIPSPVGPIPVGPIRAIHGLATGKMSGWEALAAGTGLSGIASMAAYGGRRAYGFLTGEEESIVAEERKRLIAERRQSLDAFRGTGYEGTNRYIEANMDRLKAIGIINETAEMGGAGPAGKFLFGLFRGGMGHETMRETLRIGLAGESPEKAAALDTLFEEIGIGDKIGSVESLRLLKSDEKAVGRVFEAMMQLSPESVSLALSAAGAEGELKGFDALQNALKDDETITIDELKDSNVRKQAELFTGRLLSPANERSATLQHRYFSAFSTGSLAQVFAQANAAIQQAAFTKLANLETDGNILMVKTTK